MTFLHVATVLRDSKLQSLKPTPRLILTILADMANDSGQCWPSQETIAERAGVSSKTVKNSLKTLEEAGYVTWRQRFNSSLIYSLCLPAWEGRTVRREVPAPDPMATPDAEAESETPAEAPGQPRSATDAEPPSSERILLSDAARLIQSLLPSVAWELGDTATIKEVAWRLNRLKAIGLSSSKIRELTADWPDFVHNPPGFVLSQLQRLEVDHAGKHMDARQAQRRADAVKLPQLTDEELAEERNRLQRRREQILKSQAEAIIAREEAEKHARLQAEAENAATAAAGELGFPKLDKDPVAAAKIHALALSSSRGGVPSPKAEPDPPLPFPGVAKNHPSKFSR